MEALSALRYLPRRSALCLFFLCVMFLACAFYTFFGDSKNAGSFKFVDEFDDEIYSKPSETLIFDGSRFRLGEIPTHESPSGLQNSASDVEDGDSKTKLHSLSNFSSKEKSSNAEVKTRYVYLSNSSPTLSTTSEAPTTVALPADTCSLATKEDAKLILLWTPFFEFWDYLPKEHFSQCSRCRNCIVTTDRSKLLQSDAVIFHARDMSVLDMPSARLPHQRWIFYCLESPPYSDFPGLEHTQNMFNWTMTYRSDSDITSPYGYVFKVRPPRKLDMQTLEWVWSNKTRSVVWMSSHCPTHGGRDLFAEELKKYIDVDIYGRCGTSVCPPGETEKCLQEFAQKYKFFLAFENSLCKDYITEKFFRTLKYNIIPVVFGGANYDKFSPPGAFIDALKFKSPKHLAFFLTGVGKNFKLYSSFFKWRKDYAVSLGNTKECQLCSMLHRKDLKQSSYKNLREWWVNGSKCKTWKL